MKFERNPSFFQICNFMEIMLLFRIILPYFIWFFAPLKKCFKKVDYSVKYGKLSSKEC